MLSSYHIAVIPGDGIGPEVMGEAKKVLERIGKKHGHQFVFHEVLAGGAAIDAYGEGLPKETLDTCLKSDSVLLGAVGRPYFIKRFLMPAPLGRKS